MPEERLIGSAERLGGSAERLGDPEALLLTRRIVVCVGTGGVGKTTVAAAMAAHAARAGRRALVLTIDPARRLADALGVETLGNEPAELSAEHAKELGIRGEGRLFAVMLDMKRTFDDLVERFAESAEARERILQNPIYQHVSDALAGSAEYAAMEKVYELCESGLYDVVVLDTPPSQHALDFLDAPQRLLEFLDSKLVQMLLHPALAAGRFGFRIFHRTAHRALQLFERVSGISFLEDISEFLLAFEGMSEGFRERAGRVRAMLLGSGAGFVIVAGPSPEASRNGKRFLEHLLRSGVPMAGVVVNRMRLWPGNTAARPPEALTGEVDLSHEIELLAAQLQTASTPGASMEGEAAAAAARAAVAATSGYASLVELDRRSVEPLEAEATRRELFVRRIPELPQDVHDIAGLLRIGSHLFEEPQAAGADGAAANPANPAIGESKRGAQAG